MSSEQSLESKESQLRALLRARAPLLIAYSGGVDSTLLLAIAHETLGAECAGVIADSPSLPRASLDEALRISGARNIPVEVVATTELEDPRYSENPPQPLLLLQSRALHPHGGDRPGERFHDDCLRGKCR